MLAMSAGIFAKEPAADIDKANLVTVEGTVSDKISGESLTGVKVRLEGFDRIEYTDFDGKFSFENLKPGRYNFRVEFISYDSRELDRVMLDGESGRNLSIELQPSTVNLSANNK
jgi:hypothetical protein